MMTFGLRSSVAGSGVVIGAVLITNVLAPDLIAEAGIALSANMEPTTTTTGLHDTLTANIRQESLLAEL